MDEAKAKALALVAAGQLAANQAERELAAAEPMELFLSAGDDDDDDDDGESDESDEDEDVGDVGDESDEDEDAGGGGDGGSSGSGSESGAIPISRMHVG
jgi:hypothetical protein